MARSPGTQTAPTSALTAFREKVPGAEKITPHQLRHWMATSMFADGYDPVTVAGRGGWSSPTLPMSVYGHFRSTRDQAAANALAARLDGATGE